MYRHDDGKFSVGGKPYDAKVFHAVYYEGKVLPCEVSEGRTYVLQWKVVLRQKVLRRETCDEK